MQQEAAKESPKSAALAAAVSLVAASAAEGSTEPRERKESADPRIQVLVLRDPELTLKDFGSKSSSDPKFVDYCCTDDLFFKRVEGCDEIGTVIVKRNSVHKVMSAYFTKENPLEARLQGADAHYDVTHTGEHVLIVANCDARLGAFVSTLRGSGVWKNPFGYLPGRLFGFLPFYFSMLVIYVALLVGWAALNLIHRKDIAGIQHCITVTLLLTLVEVVAWFSDYSSFNDTGVRNMGGVIAAVLLTVLRLTVSRMLVVAVSIGFPVVRPSLGFSTKLKIASLGLVYFLCESALEVVTRYSQMNTTAEKWRIFLSLPVAVLNAIFYWWIFTALHDLINYLEQQNQVIKLSMYKSFTHMLAGSLVAAVVFAIYQMSAPLHAHTRITTRRGATLRNISARV